MKKEIKKTKATFDIDTISERTHLALLKEFENQFGRGHYDCWIISAKKIEDGITYKLLAIYH